MISTKINDPIIGFAGLTHLGIISAVTAAAKGFNIICYDSSYTTVKSLSDDNPNINEKSLVLTLKENKDRLNFTTNASELRKCDIVYISKDIVTNDKGQSDLQPVMKIIEEIRIQLNINAIMVVLSQVPPGFCRNLNFDGKRLYYQVETLIFGKAIERAMFPERLIIGCENPNLLIDQKFSTFLNSFSCPILKMNYESAELAKISINMYLTASVTITNTLAEVSESIGAVWSEIVPALRLDQRIGANAYLSPGLGISGGNLERDLNTILKLGIEHKTDISIIEAAINNSNYRKDWLWRTFKKNIISKKSDPQISLLGLAYKNGTSSTKNSPSLKLLSHLHGYKVRIYDPVVNKNRFLEYDWYDNVFDCITGSDVVIICTQWDEFKGIDIQNLAKRMNGNQIIDPFALLDHRKCKKAELIVYTLGKTNI